MYERERKKKREKKERHTITKIAAQNSWCISLSIRSYSLLYIYIFFFSTLYPLLEKLPTTKTSKIKIKQKKYPYKNQCASFSPPLGTAAIFLYIFFYLLPLLSFFFWRGGTQPNPLVPYSCFLPMVAVHQADSPRLTSSTLVSSRLPSSHLVYPRLPLPHFSPTQTLLHCCIFFSLPLYFFLSQLLEMEVK